MKSNAPLAVRPILWGFSRHAAAKITMNNNEASADAAAAMRARSALCARIFIEVQQFWVGMRR
jgi:hypothetical protein